MIIIKTKKEVRKIKASCRLLAQTMEELKESIRVGARTDDFDILAEKLAKKYKAEPSFKGYKNYPASICVSVNEELVHGLPSDKVLQEGDIVSLDFGLLYKGYYSDMAVTAGVGEIDKQTQNLIETTERSLYTGIDQMKPGNHIGDISAAIQTFVESRNYSVVRNLTGHGVGKEVHEAPQVPNFGISGQGPELEEGMVIAIEPMVNIGDHETELAADGWTFKTKDNSLSAHFEHTVAVTKNGFEILTVV